MKHSFIYSIIDIEKSVLNLSELLVVVGVKVLSAKRAFSLAAGPAAAGVGVGAYQKTQSQFDIRWKMYVFNIHMIF